MLTVSVPLTDESFDDEKQEFVPPVTFEIDLEHSLVSLSKWEEKHEKPFMGTDEKTNEEVLDYIFCMILTPNVPDEVLGHLSQDNVDDIQKYIDSKRSATWFNERPSRTRSRETITSELIYFWMTSAGIDWQAQHWHLNRLFTLIRIFDKKNQTNTEKKKGPTVAELADRRELNRQRKKDLGTNG